MASLIQLPARTNAFTEYKPSKNAHTDILSSTSLGKRRDSNVGDKTGPRVIKVSLSVKATEPPIAEQLTTLVSSIRPILSGHPTKQAYHSLSASCHKLVSPPHSLGPEVYGRVKEELERIVSELASEWRAKIMSRDGGWLETLVQGWKTWDNRVKLLSAVFVYLDRVYANEINGIASIRDLGLSIFREGIFENQVLFGKTRDDLLSWASGERDNTTQDTAARSTISSLTTLSNVLHAFSSLSEPYVELVNSHYAAEAETRISGQLSATEYVTWMLEKVKEEHARAIACLTADVAEKVVVEVRREAGQKRSDQVVRRALDEAMQGSDSQALSRLYGFTVDCDVFPDLVKSLQAYLEGYLRNLLADAANDPQMIEGTLTLKRFVDKAVSQLFEHGSLPDAAEGDIDAQTEPGKEDRTKALDEARRKSDLEDAIRVGFKSGMGSRQNAPAEWIAKHLDSTMRKGQGSGTEAEFNNLLDEIIALIGFTRDKDVFKAFYSSSLAKRLLLNKSASDDMERNMIVKLQNEMGEEFTSGDIMMKDLQLSETLVKAYQSAQAKNPDDFKDAGNFTANVLTESAWPAYPLLKDGWNFKLTSDLQSSIEAFTSWYATQHKNRQLSWRWQLATVTLSARFASGKYEIGVSLFQAVVLLQFDEEDSLGFKEIKDRTGIESSELVRTLQSLALGRKGTRVLVKKPAGKEVLPTDTFAYNKSFSSERIKFKINGIQQDISAEESRKTNEQVVIDRVSVLEATIVRIMKARKKMTLQLLIDGVVTDVNKRFPPDIKEIKKRVESLIEREFLMRDEEDRNVLQYLA